MTIPCEAWIPVVNLHDSFVLPMSIFLGDQVVLQMAVTLILEYGKPFSHLIHKNYCVSAMCHTYSNEWTVTQCEFVCCVMLTVLRCVAAVFTSCSCISSGQASHASQFTSHVSIFTILSNEVWCDVTNDDVIHDKYWLQHIDTICSVCNGDCIWIMQVSFQFFAYMDKK